MQNKPTFESAGEEKTNLNSVDNAQELIAKHTLFNSVSKHLLEPLTAGGEIRHYAPGEVLLEPGLENTNLYLLLEGQLKVHLDRIDSDDSFLIKPEECAGEISVVDNKPPSAFVVVDKPSLILVLPEELLWEKLIQVPQVAKNFMRMFADRFRATNLAMQKALAKQHSYEFLQQELAFAYEFQMSMLPSQLNMGESVDIATGMQPAHELGGDFYDAFPVGHEEYAVIIGDVAGQGVPASLFMVRTMTLLRAELLRGASIPDALKHLNAILCQENTNRMFASLIVGLLNPRTGRFDYVNAGHDAIIYGAGGQNFQTLPKPEGLLVGIDQNSNYEVASLTLNSNDVLFLHTDGITEAKNAEGKLFSLTRVKECLQEAQDASAGLMADRINRAIVEFTQDAPQSDDKTMLVLRYLGTESDSGSD